ncbi:hypothetical protein DFJ74DRAFT_456747 [Hyaloraphidium curvatum]|nr:hypothetical protein DFJ74DRAFT_456747 [Hyaloraphidium curvatum]
MHLASAARRAAGLVLRARPSAAPLRAAAAPRAAPCRLRPARALATAAPGQDAFANGTSAAVLESIYDSWRQNPASVPADWGAYFNALESHQFVAVAPGVQVAAPEAVVTPKLLQEQVKRAWTPTAPASPLKRPPSQVMELIRSFRVFGHLSANLDPLGLWNRPPYAELDYKFWGFTEADLGRKFFVGAPLAPGGGSPRGGAPPARPDPERQTGG